MKPRLFAKALSAIVVLVASVLTRMLTSSSRANADSSLSEASEIQIGFAVAPVPLNLHGKYHDLVGLGSYLVNVGSDCNSCHNSGGPRTSTSFRALTRTSASRRSSIRPSTWVAAQSSAQPAWIQTILVPSSSPAI